MKITYTDRGFSYIDFVDRYGATCSLQKSSLATEDAIWFGPNDADPKIMAVDAIKLGLQPGTDIGWVSYAVPRYVQMNTRMHLTREMMAELLPHLQRFVETGELE